MQRDGKVMIEANFVNKELISFSGYQEDAITPYITFTYLLFMELNFKIIRLINSKVSDRTFSFRVRVIEENAILPNLLIGVHDPIAVFGGTGAIHNNALYLVGSKNFRVSSTFIKNISIHAGYGVDILEARNHNFVGFFGGVSLKFYDYIELMTEYDSKYFNGGFRLILFDHLKFLAGLLRFRNFSGGAALNFQL